MAKLIRQGSESVDIRGLIDADTPKGKPLSGIYKRSYAYITIKDRLPIILTKIIDTLSQDKDDIAKKYGDQAKEDIKYIIGLTSKLKNELVTNKPLIPLNASVDNKDDINKWNEVLNQFTESEGETPTWFKTLWLFCETYMYRRLYQEISSTKWLKTYDPFETQKQKTLKDSMGNVTRICQYVMKLITEKSTNLSPEESKRDFITMIKLNLWGNRCDLSHKTSIKVEKNSDPLKNLELFEKDLLVDNSESIWNILKDSNTSTVDIVLDNAAYELFTDLCLAAYLITFKLACKVRFYVKRMPWYVSDTTTSDFQWTIQTMRNSNDEHVAAFAKTCETNLKNDTWSIEEESFWTEPYVYAQMQERDPNLYKKLSHAKLVIFKGDLNYRKLIGDINWDHTTNFQQALRGFHPTNITAFRTLKCDIIVGMPPGKSMKMQEEDPDWLTNGKYGVIQLV